MELGIVLANTQALAEMILGCRKITALESQLGSAAMMPGPKRPAGEVQPDGGLLLLRLAREMKVELQHEIGALVEREREPAGKKMRIPADRPASEPSGFRKARAIEAALLKAWLQSLCRPDRMELAAALALPNV